METDRLYRVTKQDETKLIALLTECFMGDPLYQGLIPDQHRREKLLPELFRCDLDEMLDDCEIYAVNENLDGIIVVSDETEPYNPFQYFAEQLYSTLKTNAFLIKDDPSLETFFNFLRGRDYLNSSWTDELDENRLHIIYLAVRPSCQGRGYAKQLMSAVLDCADRKGLLVSLETHNPKNVGLIPPLWLLTVRDNRPLPRPGAVLHGAPEQGPPAAKGGLKSNILKPLRRGAQLRAPLFAFRAAAGFSEAGFFAII